MNAVPYRPAGFALSVAAILLAVSVYASLCCSDGSDAETHSYNLKDAWAKDESGTLTLRAGDVLEIRNAVRPDHLGLRFWRVTSVPYWMTKGTGDRGVSSGTVPDSGTYEIHWRHRVVDPDVGTVREIHNNVITVHVIPKNHFSLAFDAAGGAEAPPSAGFDSHDGTVTVPLPSDVPSKDGSVFAGWSAEPGGEAKYSPGQTIVLQPGETVLHAVWLTVPQSEVTVVCGQHVSFMPVQAGKVAVSGAYWLQAKENTVFGTAPPVPGAYTVTVACNGISASFAVNVVSSAPVGSAPVAGVSAYECGKTAANWQNHEVKT